MNQKRLDTTAIGKLSSVFEGQTDSFVEYASGIISQYDIRDACLAVFCINSWRMNRTALVQALSFNEALTKADNGGKLRIQDYTSFSIFFKKITKEISLTGFEDLIIDDFGEVFINHLGITYPIIIGTGHQQVYSVVRYLQSLSNYCERNAELKTILEYTKLIIESLKANNTSNDEAVIVFELPSEDFWCAVRTLFDNKEFQSQLNNVADIMGYQVGPIEMRHFVKKNDGVFPLFNTSILIDYYKLLLLNATEDIIKKHITDTVLALVECSFNCSPNTPNRVLISPVFCNRKRDDYILKDGVFFATINKDNLFVAFDKRAFKDQDEIKSNIATIQKYIKNNDLFVGEKLYRKEIYGGYGIDIDSEVSVCAIVINSYTDITETGFHLGCSIDDIFECSALDYINIVGFANDIEEVIQFVKYDDSATAQMVSFGGKSDLFFTWKSMNHHIESGAIKYNVMHFDFNQGVYYIYDLFKGKLADYPRNNTQLFNDPLNWQYLDSDFGYIRVCHKGCIGFGGDVKRLSDNTYLLLAHNVEFYSLQDFENDNDTATRTVDELNQRLFVRYADVISQMPILAGKTVEVLFMPWIYANKESMPFLLSDRTREMVYSDEHAENDTFCIRFSFEPQVLLSKLINSEHREAENKYFAELLKPLRKYAVKQYDYLISLLDKDSMLKPTVGVFGITQDYYFSNAAMSTDLTEISFAKVKKEIAKACYGCGIQPGKYYGIKANKIIREMQNAIVKSFEGCLRNYDKDDIHTKAIEYYSMQLHQTRINLKRYNAFKNLDDSVQKEFETATRAKREIARRNAITVGYLIESNLFVEHAVSVQKCQKEDFEFLLAYADWLVALQEDADVCHYTEFDLGISVDSEYKVDTIINDTAQKLNDELTIRKYNSEDYQVKNDETDKEFIKRAVMAFKQDTGVDITLVLSFLDYLKLEIVSNGIATEIAPNYFEIDKTVLIDVFYDSLIDKTTNKAVVEDIIEFLTLKVDELKTANGTSHEFLPIWEREKRNQRFNIKPIIQRNNKCYFSPIEAKQVFTMWQSGLFEWYLPYEIGLVKTKAVLTEWKKRYEDEMVQDIAEMFKNNGFDLSIPEIDLAKRFPKDNYPDDLGDYDVFVVSEKREEIWIIESKVLQKVGSIYEDQMQQRNFFFKHKDDEKFQKRIDYLRNNLDRILTSLGYHPRDYRIIPYMVTNKLFASRYKDVNFPIVTYSELNNLINK